MLAPQDSALGSQHSAPRRVAIVGAGPLPEAGSTAAPGVANRLWNFVQPALQAGHELLVISIQRDASPELTIETRATGNYSWQELVVSPHHEKGDEAQAVNAQLRQFSPEVLAGAGTLLAGWSACALAGDKPVWVDLFGDPLAEIQAKAEVLGPEFDHEELMRVWRLMLASLLRADAFSVVSRRQQDALLGQLALAGRLSDAARSHPGMIHTIPCSIEKLEMPLAPERNQLWAGYGIPGDARVALWSGGFNAWIDADTLLRGMERALERDSRLHFVVSGGALSQYLDKVHAEFSRAVEASPWRERMHQLGWLPLAEAHTLLAAADVGVLVDRPCAETRLGARNRLLYFAAAGVPVAATRGTEIVEELERAGALRAVPPGDPEALASAVAGLTLDRTSSAHLIAKHREYARENFLFANTARAFLEFLTKPVRRALLRETAGSSVAAALIAKYLDMDQREADWAALGRQRKNPLLRLISPFRHRE